MKLAATIAAIAFALPLVGVAHADPKADVTAVVKAHIKSFGVDDTELAGMAKDGRIELDDHEVPPAESASAGRWLLDNYEDKATFTLGAITVGLDPSGHAGWFQLPATLKYREVQGEGVYGWAKKPRAV